MAITHFCFLQQIDENQPINTDLWQIFATDDDSGENARLTFEILPIAKTSKTINKQILKAEEAPKKDSVTDFFGIRSINNTGYIFSNRHYSAHLPHWLISYV